MHARLSPTASYTTREMEFVRTSAVSLADAVLTLKVAGTLFFRRPAYAVQCERDERGVLSTVYLAKANDPAGTVYGVTFAPMPPLAARCSCPGFARYKNCKHAAAVLELVRMGELDETNPSVDAYPLPDEMTADELDALFTHFDLESAYRDQAEEVVLALLGRCNS